MFPSHGIVKYFKLKFWLYSFCVAIMANVHSSIICHIKKKYFIHLVPSHNYNIVVVVGLSMFILIVGELLVLSSFIYWLPPHSFVSKSNNCCICYTYIYNHVCLFNVFFRIANPFHIKVLITIKKKLSMWGLLEKNEYILFFLSQYHT